MEDKEGLVRSSLSADDGGITRRRRTAPGAHELRKESSSCLAIEGTSFKEVTKARTPMQKPSGGEEILMNHLR